MEMEFPLCQIDCTPQKRNYMEVQDGKSSCYRT